MFSTHGEPKEHQALQEHEEEEGNDEDDWTSIDKKRSN